jgi:hypothetical protein
MSVTSRATATSLVIVIGFMLAVSGVTAQPCLAELETAMGEIWPSMEPYIQAPRKAPAVMTRLARCVVTSPGW